jgi:hypothetical protein
VEVPLRVLHFWPCQSSNSFPVGFDNQAFIALLLRQIDDDGLAKVVARVLLKVFGDCCPILLF